MDISSSLPPNPQVFGSNTLPPITKTIGIKQDIIYRERDSVRLIILNHLNQMAIIYASHEKYYELPGGGIKRGEDHLQASRREALEEIGCIVTVSPSCLAVVEEWRVSRNAVHQISYCYEGKVVEDTGSTSLTEREKEDGLSHLWVDLGKVVELIRGAKPTTPFGLSVRERDLWLVEKWLREREE